MDHEKERLDFTTNDLIGLDCNMYCDLGPGEGIISKNLRAADKNVVAVEAPWALDKNKVWADEAGVKLYFTEFFTGDFSIIEEEVDCFLLCHAIAHFRYSPYILFEKIYNKLKPGGYFYLSTVNGCAYERVMQLFRGQPIVGTVTKDLDPGFDEVVKDFNKTGQRHIWDDWMHVKEYTKPELEKMFKESGFKIHMSIHRKIHSHWKRNIAIKMFPHLAEELVVVGQKV